MRFSDKIEKCSLSPIRKFYPYMVAAEERGIKVLHLNIGQPDVQTPRSFFDAMHDFETETEVLSYAPSPGEKRLLKAVSEYYGNLGFPVETDDILVTHGGSEALQIIFSCILDEGDEILIPEPFYPNYATFANLAGGVIRPIETTAEEGYRCADRSRIEPLINERTRAILISNPGNPTGVVLTEEERRTLLDIAKEHDLFLISDEVYRELIYTGDRPSSFLEFADGNENVVIIDSVSKRFSACGARIGTIVSRNRELIGHALKVCQSRLSVVTIEQLASAAMYESLDDTYYDAVQKEYEERRNAVLSALEKVPHLTHSEPEGAFYMMVKLPVDDAEKLQYFLLEEFSDQGETVMFAPGEGFYATPGKGKDEIRIAYVTNPEELHRALELLGKGIEAYLSK